MIAAVNIPDRLAMMDTGQEVPLHLVNEAGEVTENEDEATAILVGPFMAWDSKSSRFKRTFAKVPLKDIELLDAKDAN